MTVWQKQEGDERSPSAWFSDLLKQSGFKPLDVLDDVAHITAWCGNFCFQLKPDHIEVVGCSITPALEFLLLQNSLKKSEPGKPGRQLCGDLFSVEPDTIFIKARSGVRTFRNILKAEPATRKKLASISERYKKNEPITS